MAAACNVVEEKTQAAQNTDSDLLEAQIVAQAITELQEIQPATSAQITDTNVQTQILQTNDVSMGPYCEFDGDLNNPAVTQVIYYIEDGATSKADDRTLVDTSVQANDYDIERRSGRLPARKRVIPRKFRDYRNTSGDEGSDSDYEPLDCKPRPRKLPRVVQDPIDQVSNNRGSTKTSSRKSAKGLGRPRKHYMPTHTAKGEVINHPGITLSTEVEQKFQAAVNAMTVLVDQSLEDGATQAEIDLTAEKTEVQGQTNGVAGITKGDSAESLEDKDGEGKALFQNDLIKVEPLAQEQVMPIPKRGRGRPRGVLWKKYYKCPDCDKSFTQKGNLRVHLRVHTTERPYPCQEEGCNKAFRSNESLRRHLLSHQGIKPFECEICNNKFSSNVALSEHRSRHYDAKPHQCPHCQRMFRQVSCLRRHIVTHSKEMPYACNICHKRFSQTAYLKSHMKVHTGEKPFRCDICDKRFAHQSDVKRHKTTHTGEKPYACSKCQARFSDVSSKRRHEKEHENSKRYTCNLCNDSFKRTGQLRSHLQRKHSHTFSVKIEKDPTSGVFMFKMGEEGDPNSVQVTQQRIVSIIKNLHMKTNSEGFSDLGNLPNLPLTNVQEIGNQSEEAALATSHVTDISNLEKEVDPSVIESDIGVPIELQGVEIQGEEDAGHTYIAVTELGESLQTADGKLVDADQTECHYQIIQEITEDGQRQQILVPFNPATETSTTIDKLGAETQGQATDALVQERAHVEDNSEFNVNLTINEEQMQQHMDGTQVGNPVGNTVNVQFEHEQLSQDLITINPVVNAMTNENPTVAVETSVESNDDCTSQTNTQSARSMSDDSIGNVVNTKDIISSSEKNIANVGIEGMQESTVAANVDGENTTLSSEANSNATADPKEMCPESGARNDGDTAAPEAGTGMDAEQPGSTIDYVQYPDFSSQEYYNWLSNFTELCKVVPMPLDMSLFQKISQVHKTLSDVMATPFGAIADRENFQVLMNISKELNTIITEHLFFVMENLKAGDGKADKDVNDSQQ